MVNDNPTLAAEYSVIGCLLIAPEIAGELISLTQPEDFTVPELRGIYKAAVKLFAAGRPVDAVTIRGLIGKEYEPILFGCMDVTPNAHGWKTYVCAMQEQTRVHKLRDLSEQLAQVRTTDAAREIVSKASDILRPKNRSRVLTMTQGLVQFYEEQGAKRRFIRWGLERLDTRLYSDYGDFVVVAGRPSAGKTALALQMAAAIGQHDRVGFYSLETTPAKLMNRLVANRCVVDFGHINRRELTEEEMTRTVKWQKEVVSSQLELVHAPGMSVAEIASSALANQYKVIFVDYLQLIRGRGKDRFEQVTNVSVELHTLAQTHGIIVVALSQLSRASTNRADSAPTLTDLRESGQIEQDADAVMALYVSEDADDPAGVRRLRILKNKEGTLGEFPLAFDGQNQAFAEFMPGQVQRLHANTAQSTR